MSTSPTGYDALLEHLKASRGFDFTGYKSASVQRRVTKRIDAVGVSGFAEYLDYLQVHPDEFSILFNTIMINVTGFFRDADAWTALRDDVIPEILAGKAPEEPIRVWIAGCASGEEAYTVAILLCEALGEETFRARVKIYATDVDEEALDQARGAVYTENDLESVPEELRARYFPAVGQGFAFRKDLRRTLIFGRNDLVQDAPISRVDLLTCRNTLMYFNAQTQSQILRRFQFALRPDGFLFLGKSEMLLTRGELFRPVDLRRRIFSPAPLAARRDRTVFPLPEAYDEQDDLPAISAFDAAPVAQIVIDADRSLVLANEAARTLLELTSRDIGRPLQDLRASYHPAELRQALDAAFSDEKPVGLGTVTAESGGEERAIDIRVLPLRADDGVVAASVVFADVTPQHRLEEELNRSKSELGAAYEELQSTVEELETTNEELQSTNEELETTNEELQSTNEELETMNEELQSSNEELETTNEELRARSVELVEANVFMDTILTSMGVGVIVVDREQRVRIWNAQSEELWGVRRDEAKGQPVLALDIGLPLEQFRMPLREALYAEESTRELVVDAVDRRGRGFRCAISIVPLAGAAIDSSAAIILAKRAASAENGNGNG